MTSEDDVRSMTKLLDMLDDNEDVQNVWHNWQQDWRNFSYGKEVDFRQNSAFSELIFSRLRNTSIAL